ncbi:unnamed protein product [Ilex paraguariensis]|uniref:Uncharacterized protein n=1 Tax=Ilex paraguariensis TaxID=185542 RepID=A0ABC8RBG4_9AQUA
MHTIVDIYICISLVLARFKIRTLELSSPINASTVALMVRSAMPVCFSVIVEKVFPVMIRQWQLGELNYEVEWNNGTSFYYSLGVNGTCDNLYYSIGIPETGLSRWRNYLGTTVADGFLCNVCEKVEFVVYC